MKSERLMFIILALVAFCAARVMYGSCYQTTSIPGDVNSQDTCSWQNSSMDNIWGDPVPANVCNGICYKTEYPDSYACQSSSEGYQFCLERPDTSVGKTYTGDCVGTPFDSVPASGFHSHYQCDCDLPGSPSSTWDADINDVSYEEACP